MLAQEPEDQTRLVSGDPPGTVIALVGPTATGKTALSLELAFHLSGEIVACDSRTVYRRMDIGTAKPSADEQALVRHHMLDVADPNESYTVAQYQDEASQAIKEIAGRGRLPIVVGGTGFYARALLEGLDIPAVPPQPELRAELSSLAEAEGNLALKFKLTKVDPEAAAKINVNDRFRLIRALEVSRVLGKPFSQAARRSRPAYRTIWIGLTVGDRLWLKQAIARRLEQQMKAGLLDEVDSLLKRYGPCRSLVNTVNYKELVAHLNGHCDLSEACAQCIGHSYQLARRQLTWFRPNPQIHWLPVDELTACDMKERALTLIARAAGI